MSCVQSIRILSVFGALCCGALGQETPPSNEELQRRVTEQDERIQKLESKQGSLGSPNGAVEEADWEVGYDKGFVFRSKDMEKNPFALRINGRMQFRYTNFTVDDDNHTNLGTRTSGTPVDVDSRSDFELERARLEFRGTFWDPRMHFYLNIDADTDDNHRAIFHDFWFNYEFSRAFDLHIGKAFVPGSREWIDGSTRTHLVDRSLATTFFRPDRTVGIWAIGEPTDGFHYRAMIGNGFNTTDLNTTQVNRDPVLSATVWFEPTGDFGKGYADIQAESDTRTRFGSSLTWARQDGASRAGVPIAESNFLRLDDGTRLTSLGAHRSDLTLLAIDGAVKSQGFSLHGEFYFRWLRRIQPNAPAPAGFQNHTNDSFGGYLGAGYMISPEEFEIVGQTSTVQGRYKDSWEYALGANYYINGDHSNKLSADITLLDGSPTSNSAPGYRIGDDGVMIRLQYQIAF